MKYEKLENILLESFKKYPDYQGLCKKTGVAVKKITELYKIFKSDQGDSYNQWLRLLLPLADRRQVYHAEKLNKDFIILDEGTVIFKDWTVYTRDEVKKLKGLSKEDFVQVCAYKEIFEGKII